MDWQKIHVSLLVVVLSMGLPVVAGSTADREVATAAAPSVPASPAAPAAFPPVHPVMPPPAQGEDLANRPHHLKGIRLQPLAKAMRLILMFDRPTAYAIRQDLQYERVYLDLINTQVGFLSADLHRIEDTRLGGVWLKRTEPGLTTLELRLSSPNVKIDHFSMDDPPAIVLDLERTDQDWAAMPQIQARTIAVEAPPAGATPADPSLVVSSLAESNPKETTPSEVRPRPVVPVDQLALIGARPPGRTPPGEASPAPVSAEASQPILEPVSEPSAPVSGENPGDGQQLVAARHEGSEIKALAAEYDYFPIDAVNMTSPLGEEIMNDFLYRRWGTVLSKGLQYLELNPVNEETAYMLYLIAEARWQMAAEQDQPGVVHDLENFYSQALRVFGKGDLASFAHWRLARISRKSNDLDGAVAHLNQAIQSRERNIQINAQIQKAQVLTEARRLDEATELLRGLDGQMETTQEKLERALLTGQALVMQEKHEEAWESFAQADELYRDWEALSPDPAEMKARAALHLEKYQEAREILENISINFPYREQDKRVRAGLLYIEVLARLGDVIKAEQFYYDVFHNMEETVRGREIIEKLYRLHPGELLEGQGHYCKLLMRQGKIREAMTELDRAYNKCLREGVSTRGLDPVIELVVPSYLDHASRAGNHYDTVQIWWLYGRQIKDPDTRLRCQGHLAQAYENLGIYREALELTVQLCKALPAPSLPSPVEMELRRSRLLIKNGQVKEAIPPLEGLVTEARDWPTLQETYGLLAEAYAATGRDLESAQAWQTLSQTPNLAAETLGNALVKAGEVFLDNQMTTQTLELGLKGLIYEKELAEREPTNPDSESNGAAANPWGNDSGERLRAILGRTYFERGDYGRSVIAFNDLLARPGLSEDERCEIMMQVAECHQRLGQAAQALQLYEELAGSEATPPVWRKTATRMRDNIRWNLDNPDWAIPGGRAGEPAL